MCHNIKGLNIKGLNINGLNINTSPYHPQSNAKIERFLWNMLAKLPEVENENWELFLESGLGCSQVLY